MSPCRIPALVLGAVGLSLAGCAARLDVSSFEPRGVVWVYRPGCVGFPRLTVEAQGRLTRQLAVDFERENPLWDDPALEKYLRADRTAACPRRPSAWAPLRLPGARRRGP